MPLLDFLKLPETKSIKNLDAPATTLLHRRIIQSKPFLKRLYLDFYKTYEICVPKIRHQYCVELGSGGGFSKEIYPNLITSDILDLPHLDKRFSALQMPFDDASVDAFLMIDVFHHVPDSRQFLSEMQRCLKPGGKIVMIEPANTGFGRLIYKNFHHEPFVPAGTWRLEGEGPLSSANGALPWIVFVRDREKFQSEFPSLKLLQITPHTPFRYLLSGGVSMRQLVPSFSYPLIKGLEQALAFMNSTLGLFYTIQLEKR